jgi:hypothetical protein
MSRALIAIAAALAACWLWFLARGRARGALKRIALRVSLIGLVLGLVLAGRERGVFERSSMGFLLAMLLAVLAVAVGYLYLIRFCGTCGRMVRNLKLATCPRCAAPLPRHGMAGGVREERAPRSSSRSPDDGPRA